MKRKPLKKITQNGKPEEAVIVKVSEKVAIPVFEEESETPLCFKCDQCDFEIDFEKGLRHQVWMKHIISQLDGGEDTGMIKHKKKKHDIDQIDSNSCI